MASKQQDRLIKKWKLKGYKVINLIKISASGFPDLLALKNGEAVWIESKETGDSVKPLQVFRMKELTKLGFQCYINDQKFEDWCKSKK